MPRKIKKTTTIDTEIVNISDFCRTQDINEQIFRLELMQHLDDADTTKIVPFEVARTVASAIAATKSALPQSQESPETLTPQAIQPPTESAQNQPQKPQNSNIVASNPSTPVAQVQGQKPLPSALDELIASAEDDINLADLVLIYRNQQIAANTETRDNELVLQLRERRIERRNQVFDHIRDLNSRQPQSPELPELPPALSDEIKALSNELGKHLINLS
ncbi:MAG: hypothetical protein ACKPCP_09585 [Sphaerospermopsis kisseleviana]